MHACPAGPLTWREPEFERVIAKWYAMSTDVCVRPGLLLCDLYLTLLQLVNGDSDTYIMPATVKYYSASANVPLLLQTLHLVLLYSLVSFAASDTGPQLNRPDRQPTGKLGHSKWNGLILAGVVPPSDTVVWRYT